MAGILSMKPENANRLHPEMLKWFNELSATIERQLAIDGLTVDDVESFLSDGEKDELVRYKNEIGMGLSASINPDAVYHTSLLYGNLGPAFLMVQLNLFARVQNIKSLLRKVYKRKAATKPEEVKKREEGERRTRVFEALRPPTALARKYLNRPGEYERFQMSLNGAIDAFLEAGEFYRYQEKANAYLQCLEAIGGRRREETRKQRAQSAADAYNHHINQEIARLTARLYRKGKNLAHYFRTETQDKRFSGGSLDFVLSKDKQRDLDCILVNVANEKLGQLCSEDLRQFIVLPIQYYRYYYPLPTASYSFEEVPSLDFSFEIFAAVYGEIWLKPGKKTFDGFEFSLPWIEEKNDLILLKKPKFLGYYHLILSPGELDEIFWQTIPLVLVKGLLTGETRPAGTRIVAASGDSVTYQVQGYEKEVEVPNRFAEYLKSIGSFDGMVSADVITQKVGNIVESAFGDLEVKREIPPVEEKTQRKDTKKAGAFQLYSEGKGPSSPEVKALGLHKSTRFKYYKQYLAAHVS